ncbi:ankyrin repeat and death domain-containing protein 1A-like [Amphibalanus amphitrite]|uniref:ankyrin repeat and death domain-containing protein 1A-like n=1 Tax=Amphibalanus amphitrite TaxID=1232801 RepID=UPI001C906AA2|nr:ankyrin repeat and death domain-containing protein 1A-like [Amphibalanus amphitrite]
MPSSLRDERSSRGSRDTSPATGSARGSSSAAPRTSHRRKTARALIEGLHLHEAIIRSDLTAIESILKARVDVNLKYKGITPLMRAAKRGDVDAVKLLLAAKADIDASNKRQERAVHLAASAGHLEVLKLLIHSGADLTVLNKRGQNFLFAAVVAGRDAVIRFVLEHLEHYDLRSVDGQGWSLLHAAAHHGHREAAQLLLDTGCRADATDALGRTPLHAACAEAQPEVVRLLLRQEPLGGADRTDQRGSSCLHLAVQSQSRPVTELLLAAAADVDVANQDGETPLHLAVRGGSEELVGVLLAAGCNVAATSKTGNTALHLAAIAESFAISRSLLKKGIDVKAQNKRGETALHLAAETGNEELCRLLLDHGASLVTKEQGGRTALHVAARGGFDTLVDIMICHTRSKRGHKDISSTTFLEEETHLKLLMLPPIIRVTWLNNNQSERVEELIRAVANRYLPRGKWKVLARHWHFSEDQIEAIEHQFVGPESYKSHGYRVLRLWYRSLGHETDPIHVLQDSLASVGADPGIDLSELSANEEEMQKFASLKPGAVGTDSHCPGRCSCAIL